MAKKGSFGCRVSKEWATHLKKHGKRTANKAERRNGKKHVKAITD